MSVNASNNKLDILAPNFNLRSIDNQYYKLNNLLGTNGTVVAFICNHCPYVIKIIDKFVFEAEELKKIGISTIAIMSNDTISYPEDSFENMILFAKKFNFIFPYLYDASQNTARAYNAVCTPDIFGFNRYSLLKYRGRLNSDIKQNNINTKRELFYAMELISKTNSGPKKQFNSFGCSIKWAKNE